MKQEILILNGLKIPYLVDETGCEWYPFSWIYKKVMLNENKSISKKYIPYSKLISVNFSDVCNLDYDSIQETKCMTREGFKLFLDSCKINSMSDEAFYNYNLLRTHFHLDTISIVEFNDCKNEFMIDLAKDFGRDKFLICTSCYRRLPSNYRFFFKDDRNFKGVTSKCRECSSKNGHFQHKNEYLEHIYYKYGNEMYIKVKNAKIEEVFLMYAQNEIDELPLEKIAEKKDQMRIIKYLFDKDVLNQDNLSIKYLRDTFFVNTVMQVTIEEIYNATYKDWKVRYYNYPHALLRNMSYAEAKVILRNFIKDNEIVIDNIYECDYSYLIHASKVYGCCKDDMLDFVMYFYNNKYSSYKFKMGAINYYKKQENRIHCFKQYINDIGIDYTKIPFVISKYRMCEYSGRLYNILNNYYNGDLYEWANECYPNEFQRSDFNLDCIRSSFDSVEEVEVDRILKEYFKYKLIHNSSSDEYTVRILDCAKQPDWFIIEDNKMWIVEYFGMYTDNPKTDQTRHYKKVHDAKVEMYKNSVRNTQYYYLFLYAQDLKNNGMGIRNKIEMMQNCDDRIVGLK